MNCLEKNSSKSPMFLIEKFYLKYFLLKESVDKDKFFSLLNVLKKNKNEIFYRAGIILSLGIFPNHLENYVSEIKRMKMDESYYQGYLLITVLNRSSADINSRMVDFKKSINKFLVTKNNF